MNLTEWRENEKRIDAAQVPDGPALLDRLPRSFVTELDALDALALAYDPRAYLRPRQLAPADLDWLTWVIVTGRSWGKSFSAAAWIVDQVMRGTPAKPAGDFVLVAPTEQLAQDLQWSVVEALLPPWVRVVPRLTHQQILLPDHGARLLLWSAAKSHFRGHNLRGAWLDEIVAYPRGGETLFRNLRRALRTPGETPARCVITTTPPWELTHWLLDLCAAESTRVTRGTARDNPHVDKRNVESWYAEDTIEARRENDGAFVFGVDGALFRIDDLERDRVHDAPELDTVIVSVDPSTSDGADADPVGLAVVGIARGHGYLLASCSERLSPDEWPRRALEWGREHGASQYVVESTGAGQTAATLLRQQARFDGEAINVREVKAHGSKAFRAGPLASACANGRFHLVAAHPDFEREATTWHPGASFSPGSIDAVSHAWAVLTHHGKAIE